MSDSDYGFNILPFNVFDRSEVFFTAFCTFAVPIGFLYCLTKIVKRFVRDDPQFVIELESTRRNKVENLRRIEAGRWLRQANHDYESARNDLHVEEPAFEWVCIKCQQAVEKAIKAVFIKRNIKNTPTVHDLVELAEHLDDADVNELAVGLQGTIGFVSRMRYPDMVPPPKVPHDVYNKQDAEAAFNKTGLLLNHVQNKYLRGCEIPS